MIECSVSTRGCPLQQIEDINVLNLYYLTMYIQIGHTVSEKQALYIYILRVRSQAGSSVLPFEWSDGHRVVNYVFSLCSIRIRTLNGDRYRLLNLKYTGEHWN